MPDHSPEPWTADSAAIVDANGEVVILGIKVNRSPLAEGTADYATVAVLQRITACINACKGIPTEMLERADNAKQVNFDLLMDTVLIECERPPRGKELNGSMTPEQLAELNRGCGDILKQAVDERFTGNEDLMHGIPPK